MPTMSRNTGSLAARFISMLLRAEHLGHLGEQHAAAVRRQAVGDAAEQRVGA